MKTYKTQNWNLTYIENFLTYDEADLLYSETDKLFGIHKKIQNRRLNLTLAEDSDFTYKVSFGYGKNQKDVVRKTSAYDSIPSLPNIKERVESTLNSPLPVCAILRYPPVKGIKRHRDREIPKDSIIAGISVGEQRTLRLSTWDNSVEQEIDLSPGSLYIFYPPTNEKSFHEIKEDPASTGTRYSFTFRTNWTL